MGEAMTEGLSRLEGNERDGPKAAGGDNLKDLLGVEARSRLLGRLERYLDFERWGFQLAHVEPNSGPVIFDSPKCRVLCRLSMERGADEIGIVYGRRHAPNDRSLLEWEGEKCFAWHNLRILHVTDFLEGLSVAQVVERNRQKLRAPDIVAFMETGRSAGLAGPDASVALEDFIWERYGDRLFSLFDVRHPQRWEELRRFVKMYYELQPEPKELSTEKLFGIPPWQIC